VGYSRSVLKCFNELTIRSEPTLQLTQAYLDIKLGRFEAARELLALAATMLETAAPRVRRDFNIVYSLWNGYVDNMAVAGWREKVKSFIDELEPSDHLGLGTLKCELAVAALGKGAPQAAEAESRRAIYDMRAAGSMLGLNYAFLHLAQSYLLSGRIREADALFREALSMAEENFGADSGLKALCNCFVGYCLYLQGDIDRSIPMISSLRDTTDGWLEVFATVYEVRAHHAYARGGISDAITEIAEASRVAQDRKLAQLGVLAAAWRVEFLAMAGRYGEARREASAAGIFEEAEKRGRPGFRWRVRHAATLAVGRLWAGTGTAAQAMQMIDSARTEFRGNDLILPAYRLDALSISLLKQRGSSEEAGLRLQNLLDFAVAENAGGVLLEQGRALESLLHVAQRRNRELVASGEKRDLIASLLSRLQGDHAEDQNGFSSRELEVLRELCSGRSNKVIGQFLDLSENTVKFHLKRIFKKLGADSRAGAITAALQKNLVIPEDAGKKK